MTEASDPVWVADVLTFWFDELGRKAWFVKSDVVDTAIRQRFLPLIEELSAAPVDDALSSADRALAAVIVLDQFPRNIFRNEPRAFAADGAALAVANAAIARGLDKQIATDRRVFLYLPFEHSEALADQVRSIELIETLGDEEYTRYAHAHHDVIARFGRFPHRNRILGRTPTLEEIGFLKQPGSSF